jgi:hypothetical protein
MLHLGSLIVLMIPFGIGITLICIGAVVAQESWKIVQQVNEIGWWVECAIVEA